MKITSETIAHKDQRYPTAADWYFLGKGDTIDLRVRTSALENPEHEALLSIHEQTEAIICRHFGITDEMVSGYDMAYEKARAGEDAGRKELLDGWGCDCLITDESEPGDDKHAPYHLAHSFATASERMLCAALGISWASYSDAVLALD